MNKVSKKINKLTLLLMAWIICIFIQMYCFEYYMFNVAFSIVILFLQIFGALWLGAEIQVMSNIERGYYK